MKSVVKKSIDRAIQTAPFESLHIMVEVEEEIEWKNEEERVSQTKNLTKKLMEDFTDCYNEACNTLGVDRIIGVALTNAKIPNKNIKNNESQDEKNFAF